MSEYEGGMKVQENFYDNPKRIVAIRPATSNTPQEFHYADGTVVTVSFAQRASTTDQQQYVYRPQPR